LHTVPDDGSAFWSTRALGAKHRVGKDTVQRIWKARKLRPWQVDTFKLSNDPNFEAKLIDAVGLYLDPPERAVVFSFDEKTQCQALDRTQPSLPLKPGRGRTMTHDHKRNGTVDLFAAMNVATGEVLHDTRRSHAGADVLAFFKWIDIYVLRDLDVHVEPVRTWLAPPKRARWHLHSTPTSASWLNLIEGFLGAHPQGVDQRELHLHPSARRCDRRVGITLEPRPPTVRVDQDRRRHHHQDQSRTSHPRSRH
jgi:hypothetical protein